MSNEKLLMDQRYRSDVLREKQRLQFPKGKYLKVLRSTEMKKRFHLRIHFLQSLRPEHQRKIVWCTLRYDGPMITNQRNTQSKQFFQASPIKRMPEKLMYPIFEIKTLRQNLNAKV